MTSKSKSALAALVAAIGLGAVVFWPKKASAAQGTKVPPLTGDGSNDKQLHYPVPKDAREAYTIGTALTTLDADYVQFLADWLNANARDHADWAFALNQRAAALRAEVLLGEGLLQSTDLTRVLEISRTLQSTHPAYASLLAMRIGVQRGELAVPAPSTLQLISGGSMVVNLSVYRPSAGGGAYPVTTPSAVITPTVVVQPKATVVVPTDAPPLVAEEVKPSNDPNGTILLARILLDEQGKPGWKYVSSAVSDWQKKVGLTADGKFGPGSAVKMADEVAIMPFVRYWPLGSASKQKAVSDYRGRLKAVAVRLAPKYPEHATMLIRSADLETGQGWPTKPATAPAREPTEAEVLAAKQSLTTLLIGK